MANQNFFFRMIQGLIRCKKTVTADYTVKTGRTTDGFIVDNPVLVDTSEGNVTVTVPDGAVEGQMLLIVCTDGTNTATITTTTGSDYSLTAAGDYCSLQWTGSDSGWVYLAKQET